MGLVGLHTYRALLDGRLTNKEVSAMERRDVEDTVARIKAEAAHLRSELEKSESGRRLLAHQAEILKAQKQAVRDALGGTNEDD